MPSLVIELLDFLSFKIIAALMLRVLMTQECITDRRCWEEVNQSPQKVIIQDGEEINLGLRNKNEFPLSTPPPKKYKIKIKIKSRLKWSHSLGGGVKI